MTEPKTAPYGSWKSPLTADLIVAELIGLGSPYFYGNDIYWLELRPAEDGRQVLVRRTTDGRTQDLTPQPFNVRTRVHEYGGRCFVVSQDGTIYFSNYADQRLYRQRPGDAPEPFTPEAELRYADPVIDEARRRLICVREDHTDPSHEAVNTLVSISLDDGSDMWMLDTGHNFYAAPRLSPDGTQLSWLAWNHPNMPWDGTELWLGQMGPDAALKDRRLIEGGLDEAIFQPEWSPDGQLYFVSDRTGWWNLYRYQEGGSQPLHPLEAEFGEPLWVFGASTYAFEAAETILCAYDRMGEYHLAHLDIGSGKLSPIDLPFTEIWSVQASGGQAAFLAASPVDATGMILLDLASEERQVLRRTTELKIDPGYLSVPETIEFPTEGGQTAYGIFYRPKNKDFQAPEGEKPPLLVQSHGGPTSAAKTRLQFDIQYWTSRGIAVLDVNYGGSTGYGRAYRERLNGQWGVVDMNDCVNGARYLAERGEADGERLAITGGSAGGYTTLCALTFTDAFKAGASYFGIGDLTPFVTDTHKFESRYLDRLVGPYPERKDLYYERSPINFIDRLNTPLILLQGLEDKIVPPNQAEMMFAAVREKGLPVAYLPFEGEQHGFRKAENIKRSLEAEFYFYSRVFGFEPADPIEPVRIENLG